MIVQPYFARPEAGGFGGCTEPDGCEAVGWATGAAGIFGGTIPFSIRTLAGRDGGTRPYRSTGRAGGTAPSMTCLTW